MPRHALPFLAVLVVLVGSACSTGGESSSSPVPPVDDLFADYYEFKLRANPVEATKLGENEYNDYVANYISAEYQAKLVQEYERFLEAIAAAELSAADRLSLEVMSRRRVSPRSTPS
jgi:hypothetical protein